MSKETSKLKQRESLGMNGVSEKLATTRHRLLLGSMATILSAALLALRLHVWTCRIADH